MQIDEGNVDSSEVLDELVKNLFQTGLFSDVRIFRRGATIVVQVEENPMINRVEFRRQQRDQGRGPDQGSGAASERTIFTRSRKCRATSSASSPSTAVPDFYSARVEPKIIRLPQNRVDLVFEITGGRIDADRAHQLRRQRSLQRQRAALGRSRPRRRVVEVLLDHRQLRSRPPRARQGTAAPLLPEERLRRFPGRLGRRRARARRRAASSSPSRSRKDRSTRSARSR